MRSTAIPGRSRRGSVVPALSRRHDVVPGAVNEELRHPERQQRGG